MALKALMLRKKLNGKTKELEALQARVAELQQREAELETAITEAETEEEQTTVEEAVETFEKDKAEHEEQTKALETEIEGLENELRAAEEEQERTAQPEPEPAPETKPEVVERKERGTIHMNKRSVFAKMTAQERTALVERDDIQAFLAEVRSAIKEKRAITGVGLTIPEVVLPVLQENIERWSKLYDHVNVQRVAGTGRQPVMGTIPEAIWTECCANLNELTLTFTDWEVDCFKVGGYYALCRANVEDSDIDLLARILEALGQGIGKALDKAILYGRNTSANSRMPLGVVTRLLQAAQPADYPATARPWVDLHATHVQTISEETEGLDLVKALLNMSAMAESAYSRGELTWVMSEATYKYILAESIAVNSAGAIVAGVDGRMPVVGGDVEVLNFIPFGVIIFGYFDTYLLAERAGREFATSEHVRFIQDQIVYKGTARYDGAPVIAEAFGALALDGGSVIATAVSFAQDTENS